MTSSAESHDTVTAIFASFTAIIIIIAILIIMTSYIKVFDDRWGPCQPMYLMFWFKIDLWFQCAIS